MSALALVVTASALTLAAGPSVAQPAAVTVAASSVPGGTLLATLHPTSIAYGSRVRIQVHVTSRRDAKGRRIHPTGSIRVLDGSLQVGSETLSPNGKGAVKITLPDNLPTGTRSLRVLYAGDGNYPASSTTVTLRVVQVSTTTSVRPSKPKLAVGRATVARIEVATATRVHVRGTVKLKVTGAGVTRTYTVSLDAKGRGKINIGPFARTGKVTMVATFGGNVTAGGSSGKTTFTVTAKG